MEIGSGLSEAAQLFKILGNESRLRLLCLLEGTPRTVSVLADAADMSQPLVSQHLRTLRQAHLVTALRDGREMVYRISDLHVTHVIADALVHAQEPDAAGRTEEPTAAREESA